MDAIIYNLLKYVWNSASSLDAVPVTFTCEYDLHGTTRIFTRPLFKRSTYESHNQAPRPTCAMFLTTTNWFHHLFPLCQRCVSYIHQPLVIMIVFSTTLQASLPHPPSVQTHWWWVYLVEQNKLFQLICIDQSHLFTSPNHLPQTTLHYSWSTFISLTRSHC